MTETILSCYDCKFFSLNASVIYFHIHGTFMNALVDSLWNRTRTALEMWGTGREVNIPGGDRAQEEPEPTLEDASIKDVKGNDRMPAPPVSCGTSDPVTPIRICPHCGYEIRTWILMNLSCTRCENDIRPGEGM